jgi:hypothetical protein
MADGNLTGRAGRHVDKGVRDLPPRAAFDLRVVSATGTMPMKTDLKVTGLTKVATCPHSLAGS